MEIYIIFLILCSFALFTNAERLLIDKYSYDFINLEKQLTRQRKEKIREEFINFNIRLEKAFPNEFLYVEVPERIKKHSWPIKGTLRIIPKINKQYKDFINNLQLKVELKEVVKKSLKEDIGKLNTYFTGLFATLRSNISEICNPCQIQISQQVVFLNYYNYISLAKLKCYMMIQFYLLYNEMDAEESRYQYNNDAKKHINYIADLLKYAKTELWKCDPDKYEEGKTYLQITELLQGYIQNEIDLNADNVCTETCSHYVLTRSHSCHSNKWCRKQKRCKGNILKCHFYNSNMNICPSTRKNRRYEYVIYDDGKMLGNQNECKSRVEKVQSWWKWMFWHCSYCFCICDEANRDSDRFFNLRQAVSNVLLNRVVTGIKFIKHNRLIHLQIQEGELAEGARIINNSVQWVPVENYNTGDRNIHENQDFVKLVWNKRGLDLDDIHAPKNYVVTGVRFKMVGTHLNIEIRITRFDYNTGKLINPLKEIQWIDNIQPRSEILLDNLDVPIKAKEKSKINSESNKFLQFTHSSIDKDIAQTTIPFLDSQPVESILATPLSGAGLYYKGLPEFGGFIGPKIFTYDYSKHV